MKKKFTFQKDDHEMSVKCDVSVAKAHIVRELYANHTVTIPGLDGVAVAGPPLLLADKISTYTQRKEALQGGKVASDMVDIKFCIEYMHAPDIKMDPALRSLYTVDQWKIVKDAMEDVELVKVAEERLDVIDPLEDLDAVDE